MMNRCSLSGALAWRLAHGSSSCRLSLLPRLETHALLHSLEVPVRIPEINLQDGETDWKYIFTKGKPVVFRGLVRDWPCLSNKKRRWDDYASLKHRIMSRYDDKNYEYDRPSLTHGTMIKEAESVVVPVEMGASYMDPNMQRAQIGLDNLLDFLSLPKSVQRGQRQEEDLSSSSNGCKNVYGLDGKDDSNFKTRADTNNGGIGCDAPTAPRIYLAQHAIDDIPVLRDDIRVPEMCRSTGKCTLYRKNIWLCTAAGSVSPCHFDPFHNMLCQVVGSKAVTLFPPGPDMDRMLYTSATTSSLQQHNLTVEVGAGAIGAGASAAALEVGQQGRRLDASTNPTIGLQRNTSLVDFENPDHLQFPLFAEALKSGMTVELRAGDGLYIPYKWWHYCQTDDISCSVNFWWL